MLLLLFLVCLCTYLYVYLCEDYTHQLLLFPPPIDITKIAEHISELTKNPTPFTLKIVSQSFAIPPMIPKIIIGIHNLLIFIQFSFFHRDVSLFFTRIMLSVITLRQGDIFLAVYH